MPSPPQDPSEPPHPTDDELLARVALLVHTLIVPDRLRGNNSTTIFPVPIDILKLSSGDGCSRERPHRRWSLLEMAMREHGVGSVKEVNLVVLETDGSISIVPKSSRVVHTRKHIRQLQFRKH
jgi:hypothetical protein